MTLVGGGIFVHNIDAIHQFLYGWPVLLADFTVGITFGAVFLLLYKGFVKTSCLLILDLKIQKKHMSQE